MKSTEKVKQEFLKELQTLLKRWHATIYAHDHYSGYPECGKDVRMTVDIPCVYRDSGLAREGAELDLGSYIDKKKKGT